MVRLMRLVAGSRVLKKTFLAHMQIFANVTAKANPADWKLVTLAALFLMDGKAMSENGHFNGLKVV